MGRPGWQYQIEKENISKLVKIEDFESLKRVMVSSTVTLVCSRSNMLLELFEQIIHEPCFDVLRTKEQLGYIVFSGVSRPRGVQNLRIIIQSNRKPDFLDQRIETFLHSMRKFIEDLSDEEFEKNKTSLTDRILEKPKKLSARNAKFWSVLLALTIGSLDLSTLGLRAFWDNFHCTQPGFDSNIGQNFDWSFNR